MRGLLHRLASRAAETARPVRSNARLPFSGGGLTWADQALNADGGSVPDPVPAPAASWLDDAIQQVEWASTRANVIKSTTAAIEIHAGAPASSSPAYPRPTLTQPDAMLSAVPRLPVSEPRDGAQSQSESERRENAKRGGCGDVTGSSELQLHEAARRSASGRSVESAHLSGASNRRTIPSPLAAPTLLMPPAFVPMDASRALAAPQKAPSPEPGRQAHDDTTEVHIHIGRIDVTAVHEAPASRLRPKERPAPRSLDAYLAARSKP